MRLSAWRRQWRRCCGRTVGRDEGVRTAEEDRGERRADRASAAAKPSDIREFLAASSERRSEKGAIRKSNVTDNDSAKMATSKGVIQGYTAVAAVDGEAQIIVAAHAHGSGSEQSVLLPMVEKTEVPAHRPDAHHSRCGLPQRGEPPGAVRASGTGA